MASQDCPPGQSLALAQSPQWLDRQPGRLIGQSEDERHATQTPASVLHTCPTGAHAFSVVRHPKPQRPESGTQNEAPGVQVPGVIRQSG
jgi:hypothetical protein